MMSFLITQGHIVWTSIYHKQYVDIFKKQCGQRVDMKVRRCQPAVYYWDKQDELGPSYINL